MTLDASLSNWLEIDLEAIRRNADRLRRLTGVRLMAVVKAGAYGHGLAQAARAALRGGAEWLGVARIDEGLDLRRAGIGAPGLILGHTPDDRLAEAIEAELRLTVWSAEHLDAAAAVAARLDTSARVHLKVDTGMNRIGAAPEDAMTLARRAADSPNLAFEGIYTHFACADELVRRPTEAQVAVFNQVIEALSASGLRPELTHAANTAAALAYPEARWDMVRSGIGIYGMHPSDAVRLPDDFEPALAWKSRLTMVKVVASGQGVSYGHEYVTSRAERIGTVPVGYGDGFRRVNGNRVLVRGRVVPVVGRVCMDQCLVQLDDVPEAVSGDEVVLIGEQAAARITAEQVAARWGTINYEVTCGITERVRWIYR